MGQTGLHVDVGAIRAAAQRFDTVGRAAAHAGTLPLRFDGACAGDAHTAGGASLRRALDRLAIDLKSWARASAEIAVGLRCGAARYVDAETGAAAGIG